MKMHHLGIKTEDIVRDIALYEGLGYVSYGITNDGIQNNRVAFLKNPDSGEVIELIEPMNQRSSVYNLSDGFLHICYEVENLDAYLSMFKANRLGVVFTEKITAPALENRRVVFAYLKNKTMVEFLESDTDVQSKA